MFARSSGSLPILSRHNPRPSDEPYDIYESNPQTLSRRQQRQELLSQRPLEQSRPPSSTGSVRSLRRTPNFERQRSTRNQTPIVAATERQRSTQGSAEPIEQPTQVLSEEGDNSTTPRPTRQSSRTSAYWPQRSTHISRRTASAILYALEEAIRTPFPFTPDLIEENASMSDLAGGGPVSAPATNGRTQNIGSRAAPGPGPVPQVRTPTDIMRQRRDREARKRAERERDEEEKRRAQEEENINTERRPAPGAAPGGGSRSNYRRSGDTSGVRRSGGEAPMATSSTERRPDRESGGSVKVNPPGVAQASVYVPTSSRTATDTTTMPQATAAKPRVSSLSQGQPRPVQQPKQTPRAPSAPHSTQPQPSQTRQTSSAAVNSQAQAEPSASGPGIRSQASREQTEGPPPRGNASSFPHAFERWETLSSHWEGLTSYWIRRLEQNSDEMNREPLNQQMARQVTDLSAAGANLFHAVVELQRLRASSERKFQRWFFETRAEQERAQEVHGGLENTLRVERQGRADAIADVARMETEKNTAYQMKSTAEQMVKEMRRELQISKEEARRAWEELGRREQEERDRTTSLRNGEPTLVGGVQVVPMMQGAPSRQESSNRPSTREGPFPQGQTNLSSVQSTQEAAESPLEDEPGYTGYDPTRSETDTDPFTESGRGNPAQPSYQQSFVPSVPVTNSQPPQQTSSTSTAAAQAARVASSPSTQQPNSTQSQATPTSAPAGGTYLRYGPSVPVGQTASSSFYQHEAPTLHEDDRQTRVTEPDERSYVQSVDTLSEEDYELDAQGRPIPFRGGLGSEDSDEYDVQDQQERERMYRQRYGQGISGVEYGSGPTSPPAGRSPTSGRPEAAYTTAPSQAGQAAPVDYSGSDYGLGWEAIPRHHHPTRLSDVLEEDERSRTSPSRASQTSRGLR